MILLDSSVWIEYFTKGGNAHLYSDVIERTSGLIIPTIVIYEVHKFFANTKNLEV
jgi:predicted nucleic acid-binding protein